MPNYVKKKSDGTQVAAALDHPEVNVVHKPSLELSAFNKFMLTRAARRAHVDVKKVEIDAFKEEAIATARLGASMQGALIRTELGRVHGELLAATGAAMFDSYKVIAVEQESSRQAGTVVNTVVRNEHCADALARFNKGEFSQEQTEVAIRTADDLQAETEARIDGRYQQLTQATDRNFDGAMAPVQSKLYHS